MELAINMYSFRIRLFSGLFLAFCTLTVYAQQAVSGAENEFLTIFNVARDKSAIDPLIQNGSYYENPYYNAKGHPYIGDGEIGSGSVLYRNKTYSGVSLLFDIFNQQVILGKRSNGVMRMNVLTDDFISAFTIDNVAYKRLDIENSQFLYYQVVAETDLLGCYYYLYKSRMESRDAGKMMIYSFSDPKRKSYILIGGAYYRYKSNSSFVKIFPDSSRDPIKKYLKANKISVNEANDHTMRAVLQFCHNTLKQ